MVITAKVKIIGWPSSKLLSIKGQDDHWIANLKKIR